MVKLFNRLLALAAVTGLTGVVLAQEPPEPSAFGLDGVDPAWRDYKPEYRPIACPFGGEIDTDVVSCGQVMVPEDRRDADSRLIRLSVMRIAPADDAPSDNPTVLLSGGPGGFALDARIAGFFVNGGGNPLRAAGELIFFDQRGIGASDPRFCRGIRHFFQFGALRASEGRDKAREERQRCLAEAVREGIDIEAYTNWQNALDVRDLRRAMGFEKWNVHGASYGSQLGQGVMMVDPDGVRAAVLDSVVLTDEGPSREGVSGVNFDQSLAELTTACNADPDCAAAYPDLGERLYAVIEAYGRDPLKVDGLNHAVFTGGEGLLDDATLANMVFQLFYVRRYYGDLPLLIDALESRNVPALRAYIDAAAPPFDYRFGAGMSAMIECADKPAAIHQARRMDDPAAPRSHRWFSTIMLPCEGALDVPLEPTARRLESNIPTLVATGRVDPITPWQDGKALSERLGNATYVEFANMGHGALIGEGPCGMDMLVAFLKDPAAPLDIDCAAEISAPDFVTDWRATGATYAKAMPYLEGALPIVPGAILAGLLGSIFFYPLAAVGRRIERRRGREIVSLKGARWLSWGGALSGAAGFGLAGWLVMAWIDKHPLGLPVGVPSSVMWAGLISLLGVVLAAMGAWKAWRSGRAPTGTLAAVTLTLVAALAGFIWLTSAGLGPIAI